MINSQKYPLTLEEKARIQEEAAMWSELVTH
jgi:hypothetical protein